MKLLLDTHAFLWWLSDDARLGPSARTAIASRAALVHVSAATVWEIAIKSALGKLEVDGDVVEEVAANHFIELPIAARHAAAAGALPRHHDDPFDRLLVAQAQLEELVVVTRDPAFGRYDVRVL